MANNYDHATLAPNIPREELSEVEELILERSGFSSSRWDDDSDYYYVEEAIVEDIFDFLDDEDAAKIKADPEYGLDTDDTPLWISVLQNVLMRRPDISHFVLEGASVCDKMRPGEFGGFAILITRSTVKYGGTGQLIHDWEKELGLS